MTILGAKLEIIHGESGRMTEKLTRDIVEAARIITVQTGGFWTDQLNNEDQLAAYHKMAEEIWIQMNGRVDGFVQSVGTAASLRGVIAALRLAERLTSEATIVTVMCDTGMKYLSRGGVALLDT